VLDWLESEVEHNYRAYFHGCVPGRAEGRTVLLGAAGQAQLAIIPPENDPLEVVRVEEDGLTAYRQEKGLRAEDYPCFAYSRRAADACLPGCSRPSIPEQRRPASGVFPCASTARKRSPMTPSQ